MDHWDKETDRMKNYHSEWLDRRKRRQINGSRLAAKKANGRIRKMTWVLRTVLPETLIGVRTQNNGFGVVSGCLLEK